MLLNHGEAREKVKNGCLLPFVLIRATAHCKLSGSYHHKEKSVQTWSIPCLPRARRGVATGYRASDALSHVFMFSLSLSQMASSNVGLSTYV